LQKVTKRVIPVLHVLVKNVVIRRVYPQGVAGVIQEFSQVEERKEEVIPGVGYSWVRPDYRGFRDIPDSFLTFLRIVGFFTSGQP